MPNTLCRLAPMLGLLLTMPPALAGAGQTPPDRLPASRAIAGELAPGDIAWLRRDGFGLDSATLARYRQLGRVRFLDEQLAGDDRLPPAVAAQIRALPLLATPLTELLADFRARQQQYKDTPAGPAKDAAKQALGQYRRELVQQAAQAELLHAIRGGNQLKEQLVWFWLNHFSVYAGKGPVRVFAADYEENVIRPHALGKFRDLVMATLQSPAMLAFLDNARNARDRTNENYARELMELHTLGVGAGYSQADVQQLMRVLTGAGLQLQPPRRLARRGRERLGVVRGGLFVFNPNRHDFGDKTFLGHTIEGRGYAEIGQAVDLIVRQPACAHFISQRLAEYFVADRPPPALVDAMADTFRRSDGDIAAVLRTMLLSTEAAAPDPRKFKDPMRFVVSSLRLAYDGQPVPNTVPLANWLQQMGEPLYGRVTPDGWPLDSASWTGSGQLGKRFDFAGVIGSGRNRLFAAEGDASPEPAGPPALRDSALYRDAIAPRLSEATRHALAQAKSPAEWNTFLLSSPDFNYR
ncbi:DUF1800 domain-containing protein [Rhodanobacter denitrificans]|nr:DUF1800 domain-containing protein [Rhodanobacter denitrificans]UJJ59872.1 DUF1800 domain-containing protein [Rhodanobacter denitrificans]